MNRPLRKVAVAVLVMFGLLLANANYVQVVEAEDLRDRPGNQRVLLDEYQRERGPIYVGGKAVADSVETEGDLKYQRRYHDGKLYAPVTGFYSHIYGKTGVERSENSVLAGTDDQLFVRRLVDLLTGEQSKGGSVKLTLDAAAQKAAYKGLANRTGAVVALEPSTGKVLAMASSPSYDPSELATHDSAKARKNYDELTNDKDQPMLNRAANQTYPPGSTFKLVTAAAALSNGYRPDSEVPGPAELDLPQTDKTLPNFDNRQCSPGSDTTTLQHALERSCNTSFGAVGMDLGDDVLREQAEKFGFNQDLDFPLDSATSVFPDDLNEPQTAQSAIGQYDVRSTPLQMAMVAAGIANKGKVMNPYVVEEVRAPDLSILDRPQPEELSQAVTPEVAADLTDMMVGVVENGTGSNGQISGVKVAGKTGTAQAGDAKPHAWFVSFAPADDPKVAVAVVLENGGGADEVSGNQLAAPIANEVMKAVLER